MNMKEKDIFMCIFKVFNWMLFFIVINTILTVRITKKLFEEHNKSVSIPNSYSDFISDGFAYAFLYTMLVIFVILGIAYTLRYVLHCAIDCTHLAAASCFIFIFYTTVCILLQTSVSFFGYSPIANVIGHVIEQEECKHSDFTWITNIDDKNVKSGNYEFICSHCGKVFEKGYAIKVNGTKGIYDLLDINFIAEPIYLKYEERTHKHKVADKCDSDLPLQSHDFSQYKTCIGRFKHRIRRCKICGYEDSCCTKHTSIFQ